nr:methyltransferase domain-containing protein [Pseudopedobacter sp.]
MKKQEIISFFEDKYQLNKEQKLYLTIHAKRFEVVLSLIQSKNFNKILDIGPSFLSELLYQKFKKNLSLLGFDGSQSIGGHLPDLKIFEKIDFIPQDLNFWNHSQNQISNFDLIVCGEVLEHLYTSPSILFQNFYKSLNKNGRLIIQTPNAVTLRKRIKMLTGINPFEIPRENLKNPGHYREYTLKELIQLGKSNSFSIDKILMEEYFEYPSTLSTIYRTFKIFIPKSLRTGITIVFKKL